MEKVQNKITYACMIYEDVFSRVSGFLKDDAAFGRVMRQALKYGFYEEDPQLESEIETYICGELTGMFERNRESYRDKSREGKISIAIRWATDEEDLMSRLSVIDPEMPPYEIADIKKRWKKNKSKNP